MSETDKNVRMVLSGPVASTIFLPGQTNYVGMPDDLPKDKNTVLMTVDAPNIPRLGFDNDSIDFKSIYQISTTTRVMKTGDLDG